MSDDSRSSSDTQSKSNSLSEGSIPSGGESNSQNRNDGENSNSNNDNQPPIKRQRKNNSSRCSNIQFPHTPEQLAQLSKFQSGMDEFAKTGKFELPQSLAFEFNSSTIPSILNISRDKQNNNDRNGNGNGNRNSIDPNKYYPSGYTPQEMSPNINMNNYSSNGGKTEGKLTGHELLQVRTEAEMKTEQNKMIENLQNINLKTIDKNVSNDLKNDTLSPLIFPPTPPTPPVLGLVQQGLCCHRLPQQEQHLNRNLNQSQESKHSQQSQSTQSTQSTQFSAVPYRSLVDQIEAQREQAEAQLRAKTQQGAGNNSINVNVGVDNMNKNTGKDGEGDDICRDQNYLQRLQKDGLCKLDILCAAAAYVCTVFVCGCLGSVICIFFMFF